MPDALKPATEALVGNPLSYRLLSAGLRPRSLVLAFHNVISEHTEPRGDRSLHLPVDVFCEIVDWLADAFHVLPLDRVIEQTDYPGAKPRAAITFDDAYEGAISVAIGELWQRRLPATVFAISAAEPGQTFWWDALADTFPAGLPASIREAAVGEARGGEAQVRAWAADRGLPLATMSDEFVAASWESVRDASRLPGITVASHTRSHPNLTALSATGLSAELEGSRVELERVVPGSRPWLAYPYGLSSHSVEVAAREAGYELAFRVTGGVVRSKDPPPPRFALPRLNIPAGLSLGGFRLRAMGLLGR
jgi:peptidoglycan/xylan/chitin deacetylase (PgdA/CDA1 family)